MEVSQNGGTPKSFKSLYYLSIDSILKYSNDFDDIKPSYDCETPYKTVNIWSKNAEALNPSQHLVHQLSLYAWALKGDHRVIEVMRLKPTYTRPGKSTKKLWNITMLMEKKLTISMAIYHS